MGVDCKINLPDNVRVKDVSYLIAIAAGLKPEWEQCTHNPERNWLRVNGVEVKPTSIVEMAEIYFHSVGSLLVDGEDSHYVYYHFETERGGRLLNPRSTAFWIAIAYRLVDFFGGTIDYQDCDNVEVDYEKPRKSSRPEDGDDYFNFYKRLAAVEPITQEELELCDKYAAYNTLK